MLEKRELKEENDSIKLRLEEYKEELRNRRVELSAHDGVEDMNSPVSNAKLARKFGEIKDEEWHILFQATQAFHSEIVGIQVISDYMKRKYREDFLEERYRTAMTEEIRDKCLKKARSFNFQDSLRRFLDEYVSACLLLITSQPPILLEFNVVGEQHSGKLKQRFSTYSAQDSVKSIQDENTIFEVVWPELNDYHGVHKKRLVVIVDEKIEGMNSPFPGPFSVSTSTEEHTSGQNEMRSSDQTEKRE